ncbi:DUF4440 domain-containing protein [Aquisalibacillus elongatus]|uniref:DUF4440 domain-containing protein n=1 Tax=Aquisalibacillus elongatus TaxID=485577 RepID=A0A3N5B6D4_9BACI|nr:DUF4440 domain-containing protein [Aquisalibacillus elongatus]RPF53256.1 hypothetical protein EDC24_1753 [Aquisalibacillus elongatus]
MSDLKQYLLELEEMLLLKRKSDFERLLADDFKEFGSSGEVFTKQDQLDAFEGDVHKRMTKYHLSNFDMKPLADKVALVTFLVFNEGTEQYSYRSSIWKDIEGQWQMVFHQGTITNTASS